MAKKTIAVHDDSLPPSSPPPDVEPGSDVEPDHDSTSGEESVEGNVSVIKSRMFLGSLSRFQADAASNENNDGDADDDDARARRSKHGLPRVNYAEASSDDPAHQELLAFVNTPEQPRIRTRLELSSPLPPEIIFLVVLFSFLRARDIDTNAILSKADAGWSHFFSRNRDPILLGYRSGKASGIIFDVDSWMNVCLRKRSDYSYSWYANSLHPSGGNGSHYYIDNDLEGFCPSWGDIQAFFALCRANRRRVQKGENPISMFEVDVRA